MATDLTTVMDQIGTALATISGLRVFDFPPRQAVPPFAFVDLPDRLDYDLTIQRGADRVTFNVVVAVAANVDRAYRDQIAAYCGSGSSSVKVAIESATVGSSARVESVEFRQIVMSGGTYQGAVFTVDAVL